MSAQLFTLVIRAFLSTCCALALSGAARAQASADKDCLWLPATTLNRLLPTYGPWAAEPGGAAGLCTFKGQQAPGAIMPPSIIFTQTIEASADGAAKRVEEMRGGIDAKLKLTDRPQIGAKGFSNDASPEEMVGMSSWFGHRGPAMLMVTLMAVNTHDNARAAEVGALISAALDGSQGGAVQAAATTCPGLAEEYAKKLLTATGYRVQRVGADHCMVSDSTQSAIDLVSRVSGDSSDDVLAKLERARANALQFNCTVEDLPALGKGAFMSSMCNVGTNNIQVKFMGGPREFEVALAFLHSKDAPTAAQKAALVEIAKVWWKR